MTVDKDINRPQMSVYYEQERTRSQSHDKAALVLTNISMKATRPTENANYDSICPNVSSFPAEQLSKRSTN